MWLLPSAAVAVGLGSAAGIGRPRFAVALLAVTAVLISAALISRGPRAFAIAIVAIGTASASSAAIRSGAAADALLPMLKGRTVDVCGTVRGLRARSVEIRTETVTAAEKRWRTGEALRITAPNARRFGPGSRVCGRGRIAAPRDQRTEPPLLVARSVRSRGTGSPIRAAASRLRERFSEAALRALPRTQAGLLLGMTEGDVALIDAATMDDFRTTGLAHLVAVSGSNVAVVLACIMVLARSLIRHHRWLRVAVCLPPLVFFAFVTGLEPSVLRATVTAVIALVVTAEGRRSDGIRIASASFIVLVLASPELLVHPGFQLSFAATLGLILWAQPISQRIERRLPPGGVSSAVAMCIATTVAAQVAAAPLLAWHFGRIPVVGGLANLIVAPLAPVVMVGGSIALGVACIVPGMSVAPVLLRLLLDVILWSSHTFARLPLASIDASIVGGAALISALIASIGTSRRMRVASLAFLVAATGVLIGGRSAGTSCSGPEVVALDVGQGTAVLLRTDEVAVLVDGGPASGGVVSDLAAQGVDRLDAAFVSHPHADHTEGVVAVLDRLEVGRVLGPVTIGWRKGAEVVRAAERAKVPVSHVAAGEEFAFAADLRIEVLSPEAGPTPTFDEEQVHGHSLVLRARIGDATVLLPGDVGAAEEGRLVDADVAAAILVAPHHGSKDMDPRFFDAVDPELTVVTVGEHNRYGHPAPEAMREYTSHGSVVRTDEDGTISLCVVGEGVEVTTAR
jgi:competence protein ComEC